MTATKTKALALAKLGLYVFPCSPTTKKPITEHGVSEASIDSEKIESWWNEHPKAAVGVAMGLSGLVALDIDVKRDDFDVIVKDGYDSLDQWDLDVPVTFNYVSLRGEGQHHIYKAPEDVRLSHASDYRKMPGIDRRGGVSYVVWVGDVPKNRSVFNPAPEWLLDEAVVRTADEFDGPTQLWYESLVEGQPNLRVRNALGRIKDDMVHTDMLTAQFEAVRLGAEGNPGVPVLLEALETQWLSRPAEHHSTPESKWESDFARALASAVEKFGGAIELLKEMPEYNISMVPAQVPARFIAGEPGDKDTFRQLMMTLLPLIDDDLQVISILWNCPTTKDISREWGLEFVHKRVTDARVTPEPKQRENPTLEQRIQVESTTLMTQDERSYVLDHPTFIDDYCSASASRGFSQPKFAVTGAWTLLSVAYGFKGIIPIKESGLGLNLWFNVLGYSGTGKSTEEQFLRSCLDLWTSGDESYYNLGANSSPEGMHEALLDRDKKPSMVLHDEASDFFDNLKRKDWMMSLKDQFSKWYDGYVPPMTKIRLKELKGKSAHTSFNIHMFATPDRLLGLIDRDMFETGFLSRFNWVWGPEPVDDDERYLVKFTALGESGENPRAFDLVADLIFATRWLPDDKAVMIGAEEEAHERLELAYMMMDREASKRQNYETTQPAVVRLGRETIWKCAALLALYRGEKTIRLIDALTSIYYAEEWYNDLFRVVDAAGEGEFQKDCNEIEAFIKSQPKGVSQQRVYNTFKRVVQRSVREMDERLTFLQISGRIVVETRDSIPFYLVNGG